MPVVKTWSLIVQHQADIIKLQKSYSGKFQLRGVVSVSLRQQYIEMLT